MVRHRLLHVEKKKIKFRSRLLLQFSLAAQNWTQNQSYENLHFTALTESAMPGQSVFIGIENVFNAQSWELKINISVIWKTSGAVGFDLSLSAFSNGFLKTSCWSQWRGWNEKSWKQKAQLKN
jgi:hypothetical protein